jgi:hypothetical protein
MWFGPEWADYLTFRHEQGRPSRRGLGNIDQFLRLRADFIATQEPGTVFARESTINVWYLSHNENNDNEAAVSYIRQFGLQLIHVPTAEFRSLEQCAGTHFLLATTWEPYSAITIGTMKRAIDDGLLAEFGIVLFQHFSNEARRLKHSAWYWPHLYVLAPESYVVRALISRVPISIAIDSNGRVGDIMEGIVE